MKFCSSLFRQFDGERVWLIANVLLGSFLWALPHVKWYFNLKILLVHNEYLKKSEKIAFKHDVLCCVSLPHFSPIFISLALNNTVKEKPEHSF